MSKPPFKIPMRAGTQLWPRVIQLPTTTTFVYNGIGDTAEEKAEAVEAARRNCERHDGAIKQFYLHWHQAVEASSLTYLHKSAKIAPGIEATFTANYGMEYLHVKSSVQVKIDVSEPKTPKWRTPVKYFMFIVYNWSSGRDLDTITRFFKPLTKDVGWAAYRSDTYNGKLVMSWSSGDNTSSLGPEVVYANPAPMFDDGLTEVVLELNANWYAELGNRVTVTVLLFSNPQDKPIPPVSGFTLPSEIIAAMQGAGMKHVESLVKDKTISLLSQATPVQRVGVVTLRLIPITPGMPEGMKDYEFTFDLQSGTRSVVRPYA